MLPTRREFLKASLGGSALLSLGGAMPEFLTRAAMAAGEHRDAKDTVLIVVQLSGGNDGLNTVVPYENDDYGRNRTTLRLTANDVHEFHDQLGFHPELGSFVRLFDEKRLSIVQGVGYPKPSGDHAVAMRDWQTARPGQTNRQTGWLGRTLDACERVGEADVPAAYVSEIKQPLALNAERTITPTINAAEQATMKPRGDDPSQQAYRRRLAEATAVPRSVAPGSLLGHVQQTSLSAYAKGRQVEEAVRSLSTSGLADYPPFPLAERLRMITRLIQTDLGVRIYYTDLGTGEPGGFDNHANQRDNHAALLHQLALSVTAFVDGLVREKLLDRVLLMTFSEFGRTLKENGRRGTDHGSAQPIFLAGGRLKGGLIGEHPSLGELENGGPKHHTDFRRLYATVLERWLGFDSRPALGEGFEPLDVFETA